ncbi:MAG: hypothetical protein AAF492_17080, partial [Verrucomicrobiota bacterium]
MPAPPEPPAPPSNRLAPLITQPDPETTLSDAPSSPPTVEVARSPEPIPEVKPIPKPQPIEPVVLEKSEPPVIPDVKTIPPSPREEEPEEKKGGVFQMVSALFKHQSENDLKPPVQTGTLPKSVQEDLDYIDTINEAPIAQPNLPRDVPPPFQKIKPRKSVYGKPPESGHPDTHTYPWCVTDEPAESIFRLSGLRAYDFEPYSQRDFDLPPILMNEWEQAFLQILERNASPGGSSLQPRLVIRELLSDADVADIRMFLDMDDAEEILAVSIVETRQGSGRSKFVMAFTDAGFICRFIPLEQFLAKQTPKTQSHAVSYNDLNRTVLVYREGRCTEMILPPGISIELDLDEDHPSPFPPVGTLMIVSEYFQNAARRIKGVEDSGLSKLNLNDGYNYAPWGVSREQILARLDPRNALDYEEYIPEEKKWEVPEQELEIAGEPFAIQSAVYRMPKTLNQSLKNLGTCTRIPLVPRLDAFRYRHADVVTTHFFIDNQLYLVKTHLGERMSQKGEKVLQKLVDKYGYDFTREPLNCVEESQRGAGAASWWSFRWEIGR